MADFEIEMDHHFEAAGIKDDPTDNQGNETQSGTENNDTQQVEKTVGDIIVENNELQPDDQKKTSQGEQQASGEQNKQGSQTDSTNKPGEEKKGQSAAGPGDLTLSDGSVVKAGAERRWYNEAQTFRTMNISLKDQINTANQKATNLQNKLTAFEDAAKAVGVADPTDMSAALRLYKDMQSQPIETLKKLLAEAKANGYTIDGIGANVDTAAISRIIDEKLPKTSEEDKQQGTQVDQEALAEVTNFLNLYPDAILHEQHIAALIEQHPNTPLVEAYLALKNSVEAKGFDWSKPLGPQIEAAKQQGNQGQTQTQNQKPMIEGNGGVQTKVVEHDAKAIHKQADSLEDAIRSALKENGIS